MIARPVLRAAAVLLALIPAAASAQNPSPWPIHSMDRPVPTIVAPAPGEHPTAPPADALVLFGGDGLAEWQSSSGAKAAWKATADHFEVLPGAGPIRTRAGFGDVQLHIEWMAPPSTAAGQDRGNSGVFFMERYEVQVLDSWKNRTYADGQAASIYGQFPPLVNASRPPGEWQAYDIVFREAGEAGEAGKAGESLPAFPACPTFPAYPGEPE